MVLPESLGSQRHRRQLQGLSGKETSCPWIHLPPANERMVKSKDEEFEYTDNGQTKHKNRILIHNLQHSVQEAKQCLWQSTQEARTWLITDSFAHFLLGSTETQLGKTNMHLYSITCNAVLPVSLPTLSPGQQLFLQAHFFFHFI